MISFLLAQAEQGLENGPLFSLVLLSARFRSPPVLNPSLVDCLPPNWFAD